MKALTIILALFLLGPGDGDDKGRRANALYRNEQYVDAANLYREALIDIQSQGPGTLHSGLLNNLGAALYRQGDFERAVSAFTGAARMSTRDGDAVRASYNAGNAAVMQEELESALDWYTRTLLADPTNADAKFNYEFVKRQLEQQQQQQNENQQNQDQQDQEQQEQDQQNQDQQEQDQQNQDQQNQDQQEQDQQNQDQQEQETEQQPEQPPQPNPEELTQEEAERLLQALENEEQQLLRQIQKMDARPRRVEKDW